MQKSTAKPQVDEALLRRFQSQIKNKVPHLIERDGSRAFVNPTPLEDLTAPLIECARVEYGLEISGKTIRVFGQFESKIIAATVNVRPAVEIMESEIASEQLRSGK